jgi:biotin operon repressor
MKLHQLRMLLAVAQHGSIHEAARSLHISQPALSKAIAELERELGVTLMSRSVRGVSLTAYGWRWCGAPPWWSRNCGMRWKTSNRYAGMPSRNCISDSRRGVERRAA